MGRRKVFSECLVIVTPHINNYAKPERQESLQIADCKAIADQIRRHVDGLGLVDVEAKYVHDCEYCGRPWTEDGDTYNGGCCGEDEEGNPNPDPEG